MANCCCTGAAQLKKNKYGNILQSLVLSHTYLHPIEKLFDREFVRRSINRIVILNLYAKILTKFKTIQKRLYHTKFSTIFNKISIKFRYSDSVKKTILNLGACKRKQNLERNGQFVWLSAISTHAKVALLS